MRFIHTADWHLGSQRSKVDADLGLNARLLDFYRCARFTIEDGIERGAQAILHAGDVFNTCRPSPTEVALFRAAIALAQGRKVPIIILLGNHDQPKSPAEKHALDLVANLEGVTVVDAPTILGIQAVETNQGNFARIVEPKHADLLIACLPWPNKQLLLGDADVRRMTPGEVNLLMRETVMTAVRGLAIAAQEHVGIPAMLLAHCALDMAQAGGMNRLMLLGGEWTLTLSELQALPFCYFALGHIHKPQGLGPDIQRPVVYCGSPEAVTFGEEGEEKGYSIVDIECGRFAGSGFIPTPYRPFLTIDLWDGGALPSPDELKGAIVRVRIPGAGDIDLAHLRLDLQAAGVHEYQLETQRVEAVRQRAEVVSAEMSAEQALRAWIDTREELKPMADDLVAEARILEQSLQEAANA